MSSSTDASRQTIALRSGPVPLYHQLQDALRDRIASGEWEPGDQLPTIRELCSLYGVSRMTVVQALSTLTHEGLLTSRQGKGIFVAEPRIEQGPIRLTSFTEESAHRGHRSTSRILRLERVPAPIEVAARLELTPGDEVVVLERLRVADGKPMGLQTAYLPERYFPGLADIAEPIESLYRLLQERYGITPAVATDTYTPICIDRNLAGLLEVRPRSAAFSVERVTRDQWNRVIEYVVSVLRGDRYKVVLKLDRP